ncbi:hypothetical protein BH10BAC4_BH10BAC4_05410 [soil metagenome]
MSIDDKQAKQHIVPLKFKMLRFILRKRSPLQVSMLTVAVIWGYGY